MTESKPEQNDNLSFEEAYHRVLTLGATQPPEIEKYDEGYWDALDALYRAQQRRYELTPSGVNDYPDDASSQTQAGPNPREAVDRTMIVAARDSSEKPGANRRRRTTFVR